MDKPICVLASGLAAGGVASLASAEDLSGWLQLAAAIIAAIMAWLGRKRQKPQE